MTPRNDPCRHRKVGSTDTGRLVFMPVETPVIIGARHNMWTVLGEAQQRKTVKYLLCQCDCGTIKEAGKTHVFSGASSNCGCVRKKMFHNRTHGESGANPTGEHESWRGMRERCKNPNHIGYHRYGGRGIKVCERWNTFENFLADMGRKPTAKHSIDRMDGNGDYEPSNCRWATDIEQANNRRGNILVTAHGKTQTIAQWARELDMPVMTIYYRHRRGRCADDVCSSGPLVRRFTRKKL